MRTTRFALTALTVIGTLLAGGYSATAAAPTDTDQALATPARYLNQTIDWQPCLDPNHIPPGLPPGSERLQCGSYTTPRDWHHPEHGPDLTIAVSRLRPVNGQPKGTVLTNPGGPGAAGRTLPLVFLASNRTKLLDSMEIVGIDVRGTGSSSAGSCGDDNWVGQVDPRDRSDGNLDLLLSTAQLQAKFCQVKSSDLGRYITTEQTVRDLDLLRHLLGRDKVNWIGYSGGTWLGAYYATYFPNRVDKFVLDSNADFTGTWHDVFARFGLGFERRFREDYLPWVATYDSVFHLGVTGEQVRRQYESLRAALTARPVALPDGNRFTAPLLDFLFVRAMYSKSSFSAATKAFNTLIQVVAAPTDAGRQALVPVARQLAKNDDAENATFHAIMCNDMQTPLDPQGVLDESGRQGRQYPLVGYFVLIAPCTYWHRPDVQLRTPTGRGVPPVLMVQSQHDPATPYEGALRAHQRFAGSRMLTVTNEGDHGQYAFTNPCVNDTVEAFVVDGRVPTADLSCAGVGLPVPTAEAALVAAQPGNPIEQAERFSELAGPLPR
ncbi:alpha/beta hydrolase [Solihabitans fulvus]|uniref:Alpha/beta hydrolase n=1 Tax=Solihabitans fulvus TaxID=1892852 RepID=A0A5B2WPL7_9PSEU|nr:alpha/beta hydrolase [Solihabitans fulvus]KAA2253903.1 alpha/beta hydrolase [Solihabitans fulvus]